MQDNEKTIIDEAAFAKNEAENKTVIESKGSKLTFAQKAGAAAAGSIAVGSFVAWGLVSAEGTVNPEVLTTDRDEDLIIIRDDEGRIIEIQSGGTNYTAQNAFDDVTALPAANNVSDDMSFNQAFAAARAEVGPRGVFYWHGMLYGTYYETEWNAMTAEERADYWHDVHEFASTHTPPVHYTHTSGNESNSISENVTVTPVENESQNENIAQQQNGGNAQNTAATVQPETSPEISTPAQSADSNDSLFVAANYEAPAEEVEVEVDENTPEVLAELDMNQDGTTDAYHIVQDGNHALIFDRNQDGTIDAVAVDTNNDNRFDAIQIDENFDGQVDRVEQIDIPYDAQSASDNLAQNDFDNNADMSSWA